MTRLAAYSADVTGGANVIGHGADGRCYFWLQDGAPNTGPPHVAFVAQDRATADAFHAAGLAACRLDNGPPGARAHYHPDDYGAFVLDPEGRNIEAVRRRPA